MSARGGLALIAALCVVCALSGCSPRQGAVLGVGVDASGRPVGYLKVCDGAQMDRADVYAEPIEDGAQPIASWVARPPAIGTTTWSFDDPADGWDAAGPAPVLEPDLVYNLQSRTEEGSVVSEYVLFTVRDLHKMTPGEVRVYDNTRPISTGEPTGSPQQQAQEDNRELMRVISTHAFEQLPCPN